jgi:hypothetical protein
MSSIERLQEEIAELANLLEPLDQEDLAEWSPEWMSRQSLLTRDTELRHALELAKGDFEFEIRLVGERVHEESIEVSFLGRFLDELQATLNAVGQSIMFGSLVSQKGRFRVDVLDASSLRMVATQPGSFVIGLEGPERDRQLSFLDDDEADALPVLDEAISRVLDVIDVAENDVAGEGMTRALGELGGERPLKKLIKLAGLMASNGTSTVLIDRSPFSSAVRESTLTSAGARRLETILSRTHSSTESLRVEGRLTGVRWKSGVFDLEPLDEGDAISGRIASELRDDVRAVFDRPVVTTIERTTVQTEIEGTGTTTFRLVGIESLPQTPTT